MKAIAAGLRAAGFPDKNLFVTSSLEEATTLIRHKTGAGDTVLFENDLPDNYSET